MPKIIETVRDYTTIQDDAFDETLLININTALFGLFQMGVVISATQSAVTVTADSEWTALNVTDPSMLEVIKDNVCLKVKRMFDGDKYTEYLNALIDESDSRLMLEIEYRSVDTAP